MNSGEIVTQFIRAVERGDLEEVAAFLHEDVSYENMPMAPIVGRDTVMSVVAGFVEPAQMVDWKVLRQWEVDGVVINERIDRFRIGSGWLELPVAGFFECDDAGLIRVWRDYFDLGSYTRQMAELAG